jgi:vacuolar-type H+-ATPase subunit B/Vma2
MYSGKHVQIPLLHCAFGPQGDGLHGSIGFGVVIGTGEQNVNGSPVNPSLQLQIGTWFNTWQFAFDPQDPGQGSLHFRLIQASWLPHSELITHSGRQFGGAPW